MIAKNSIENLSVIRNIVNGSLMVEIGNNTLIRISGFA
jgi:hypothetical protein